ncbi:MAG: hypothetical protein CMJ81_03815 [Planctomycetaceae bacterium]|nr:hypothetical protein [Planctomycetaceae bacterium]
MALGLELDRRVLLKAGTASLFGLDLAAPLLAGSETPPPGGDSSATAQSDLSVIIVWLKGGLSTIDTLDMKPSAPAEIRGEFQPISTVVPGIQVCEHLPKMAQQMDKFSLVRNFGHRNSSHEAANHFMLTGYHPTPAFNAGITPNNERPAHGSLISHELESRGSLPSYVCLPRMHPSAGAAYLGGSCAPFTIEADPSSPSFSVPDVVPAPGVSSSRSGQRASLLAGVDRFHQDPALQAHGKALTFSQYRDRAFRLMSSETAQSAFDLRSEPESLRDEYGRHVLGQSCLMARRMVEGGVRCVHLDTLDWDTHAKNFLMLKQELLPMLDTAVAALFRDLHDRGTLDKTLVVVSGEFGRTSKINSRAGRDHWAPSFTVALGGGGIQGGRVVGASNRYAEKPVGEPYGPADLAATIFSRVGINPVKELHTPDGRPVKITNDGRLIRELF